MNPNLEPYTDIVNLLSRWGDTSKREKAPEILALRQYDKQQLCEAMSAILISADAETRQNAIDALRHLVSIDVMINLLIPSLTDPSANIRWTLCELFHQYADSRVTLPLVKILQDDVDPDVRVVAAEALFSLGDERAIPALSYAVEHDDGKDFEGRTVAHVSREAIVAIEKRIKSV